MSKKATVFQKFKVLWELSNGFHKNIFLVFFLSLISGLFISVGITTMSPILTILLKNELPETSGFLGRFTDLMISLFPNNPVQSLIIVFISLVFIMGVTVLFTNWKKFHLINLISHDWRQKIFGNYLNSRFAFFNAQKQGTLFHNSISEPQASAQTLRYLFDLGINSINAICYVVFLSLISWQLTIALLFIGFLFAYVPLKLVNRKAKRYGRQRIKYAQDLTQNANQALSGFRQILLYNQVEEEVNAFSDKSLQTSLITARTAFMQFIPRSVRDFVLFLLIGLGIGAMKVMRLDISSYLPLLATYGFIGMKLFPLLSTIISNIIALSEKSPSVKLIYNLISDKSQLRKKDKAGESFIKLEDDIKIKNVNFAYENGNTVFSELNLIIPKGKMTALIGPSGIGKSTLVDLIVGLYDDYSGEIYINGKELQTYARSSLWDKISYVSQDPFIFNRTIRENILLNQTDKSEEDIRRAIEISGCQDFMSSLDRGLDTVIGERGTRLSGGQRQRVSIARAVLRQPEIYIFDEATSALDNETEKLIQKSIEEISKTSTVIVIAHRLSTIENADTVYDLSKLV